MEKVVVFRDYGEQQSADHNNLQLYARGSLDNIVHDAVTQSLRYSGFSTVKTNQAEITVAPGRFYGLNTLGSVGAVFNKSTSTVISLVQYLAVSSQRYLTLVAYGVESLSDQQTRDFLTNVTTGQTEPQVVPMTSSRDAALAIVAGAEGADPQTPAAPATQVAVAHILMDTTGVVSVSMVLDGEVTSTEDLDQRLDVVEFFDSQIGPRVSAIAADLADLANRLRQQFSDDLLTAMMCDLAEVKTKTGLPATHSQYGATYLLWPDDTLFDVNNSQALGWDALIEYGGRFPKQNAALFSLSLFNPLDPNAAYSGTGLLLPTYTSVLKLKTGNYASSVAIGQYGYQTFNYKQLDIPYQRVRNGGSYYVCSNSVQGWASPDTSTPAWWLPNFETYRVSDVLWDEASVAAGHAVEYYNYLWIDSWTEPYWVLDSTTQTFNGALVWQSFLISSDSWLTRFGIWIQSIASVTDISITICQCTNGTPDLNKVLSRSTLDGSSLHTGMNYFNVSPIFASKGKRLAVVISSQANHQIGLAAAGSYLDGTFGYSLDGAYFLGDFTKEMVLEVYSAKFETAQTTIEFGALNLSGGIRSIDLTARTQIPASCQLVFEVLPEGTGTWLPISREAPLVPFQNAPVLCRFRGRFVGTPDIMPGIRLPDSICKIWAPAATMKIVTEVQTLLAASTTLSIKLRLEHFNTVAHTCTVALYYGDPFVEQGSPSVGTALIDVSTGAYEKTYTWTGLTSTDEFTVLITGGTNSVSNVFHVAEMLWWV